MTSYELEEARSWQKHKENMRDPAYRAAYQEMQKRKKEREKSEEALKRFGGNGACPPPEVGENHPKEKAAGEMRHEELISLFS